MVLWYNITKDISDFSSYRELSNSQFVKEIEDTSFEINSFYHVHISFYFHIFVYFQSEGDEEYWQASGAVKMRQTGFNIFDDEMVGRDCANLYNLICQCSRTFLEHVERPPHWP